MLTMKSDMKVAAALKQALTHTRSFDATPAYSLLSSYPTGVCRT